MLTRIVSDIDMSNGNIIFVGDWVKISDLWEKVVDIDSDDMICTTGPGKFNRWINADDVRIEKVLSDNEMQVMLGEVV